jgi:hypothetical protein
MELEGQDLIFLELKYCERCGGLWMRLAGSDDLYCAGCALEMMDLAFPRKRKTSPRLPVNRGIGLSTPKSRDPKTVVCEKGGNA